MAGMNSGTTSWGVAITLIVFAIIVDLANYAYVNQGSLFSPSSGNFTEYNSSATATNQSSGVGYLQSLSHVQVTHSLPEWIQYTIYVANAMILLIVYMLIRGVW